MDAISGPVLYAEVNGVCILFLLLISFMSSKSIFLLSERRGFLMVTTSNIVLFLLDILWVFIDSRTLQMSSVWNWIVNACYFSVSGFAGFCWFYYSETIQGSKLVNNKWYLLFSFLPEVALIIMAATSYQNHLLFYIDESNVYHRGPGFFVQLVLAYGYVIFTAVKAFFGSLKAPDYRRKVELRTLSFYIVPTIVAGLLQVFFPGYPILPIGTTFGMLFICLSRQSNAVAIDKLTGLNNRAQLFQYLSVKLRRADEGDGLYLMMLDADKFKSINDKYGHIEGDNALCHIADSLKKSCNQKNIFVARYGGDEFTVVCELDSDEKVLELEERIKKNVDEAKVPYHLSVSIGHAKYTSDIKTQQEFIALADKELYQAKKQRG